MRIFFYSDPHFGHKNIIRYCSRPFSSLSEMHEKLVERYNEEVGEEDLVYWCGDGFFGNGAFAKSFLDRMNGYKVLVYGNHDRPNKLKDSGFQEIVKNKVVESEGVSLHLNHFPIRFKQLKDFVANKEVPVHGHTHNVEKISRAGVHVGVDAWDYRPVPMKEVLALGSRWRLYATIYVQIMDGFESLTESQKEEVRKIEQEMYEKLVSLPAESK